MNIVELSNRVQAEYPGVDYLALRIRELGKPIETELAAVTAERDGLRDELSRLADAGTGYSQQTMDAIVKERDRLKTLATDLAGALFCCDVNKFVPATAKQILDRARKEGVIE